jgi:hypothetical protein
LRINDEIITYQVDTLFRLSAETGKRVPKSEATTSDGIIDGIDRVGSKNTVIFQYTNSTIDDRVGVKGQDSPATVVLYLTYKSIT